MSGSVYGRSSRSTVWITRNSFMRGGKDGPLVADAAGQHPVIVVELRALGPRGAVGALGQRCVSRACTTGAAFAGAGVVAWSHAGPGAGPGTRPRGCAEMARLAESVQVRPDLDEDGAGAAEIDAWNRLQQPQGALVIGQGGPNASVHVRQRGVGAVGSLHLHLPREQRQRVERGGQLLRTQQVSGSSPLAGYNRINNLQGCATRRSRAVSTPCPAVSAFRLHHAPGQAAGE